MIAEIIIDLCPDIVTIQEVQIGRACAGNIGAPISPKIVASLQKILTLLQAADSSAGWALCVSPVNNSNRAKSMSDAYAFFWKAFPAQSKFAHADPAQGIICLQEPTILRLETGNLKGRRPGMMVFGIAAQAGDPPIPLKILSWHAPTPCNMIGKYGMPSSGRGIMELAYLDAVGGSIMKSGRGGQSPYQPAQAAPLPEVDTMLLADTNYQMDASQAEVVYHNLCENYTPCISTPGRIVKTTYSCDPTQPFKNPGSYDNIFVLKDHDKWKASFTFTGSSGSYDFIKAEAEKLGKAAGISYYATATAWYVNFTSLYKKQYGLAGISDHLPVWADFEINRGTGAASAAIKPTDGANNNCVFHATFGGLDARSGLYTDPQAATRRTQFALWLQGLSAANLENIRQDLLSSLIEVFSADPTVSADLRQLISNSNIALAAWNGLADVMKDYITGILQGRMLLWHEVSMIAQWQSISIRLWTLNKGAYFSRDLNAGHGAPRDIYHFGVHFFRYHPS